MKDCIPGKEGSQGKAVSINQKVKTAVQVSQQEFHEELHVGTSFFCSAAGHILQKLFITCVGNDIKSVDIQM